jgi:predicted DNA-binding transcriptional regulator YafY
MSITKNALLRYQTLDRCFKNTGRSYLIEDLLEEVNQTLFEDNSKNSGIQIRQLREDIRFMRSELGYSAPIDSKEVSGKKHAYFYSDPSFSINNSPLNSTEAEQIKSVLTLMNRFQGNPGFEWLSEMSVILKDTFHLKSNDKKVISFEGNIDYTGHEFITPIFNAIVNKRVLQINYTPFGKDAQELNFHPYHLKQYNNRWFVFGLNQNLEVSTWNLALDRIESLIEIHEEYIEDDTDWDYYFSEIIGVSKPYQVEETEVQLLFSEKQAPYILTKPIHETQKDYEHENGLLVKIKVIPNFELEQLILSFGEGVKVLSPIHVQKKIVSRIQNSLSQYNETDT